MWQNYSWTEQRTNSSLWVSWSCFRQGVSLSSKLEFISWCGSYTPHRKKIYLQRNSDKENIESDGVIPTDSFMKNSFPSNRQCGWGPSGYLLIVGEVSVTQLKLGRILPLPLDLSCFEIEKPEAWSTLNLPLTHPISSLAVSQGLFCVLAVQPSFPFGLCSALCTLTPRGFAHLLSTSWTVSPRPRPPTISRDCSLLSRGCYRWHL